MDDRTIPPVLPFIPLVIVGAARSGTNVLRDLTTAMTGCATWPCDEINGIWRRFHATFPHDELPAEAATPRVATYIRRAFLRLHRRHPGPFVIEKTCANSLRMAFVRRVLPEAKYVFLVRDGRDVVRSAMARWTGGFEWDYLIRKALYVPLSQLPRFAWRFCYARWGRILGGRPQLSTWGPRFDGIDECVRDEPLAVVCTRQWQRSVELARREVHLVPVDRLHQLSYEQLVEKPDETLQQLAQFLHVTITAEQTANLASTVISRDPSPISDESAKAVDAIVEQIAGDTLQSLGYPTTCQRALAELAA